jgi:hypothetical protein
MMYSPRTRMVFLGGLYLGRIWQTSIGESSRSDLPQGFLHLVDGLDRIPTKSRRIVSPCPLPKKKCIVLGMLSIFFGHRAPLILTVPSPTLPWRGLLQ